ncbi:MAG: chemotaxis protein CheX [Planctomycetes bacterium]|nr:chemotaxis protein CheX [Planctomycetota bacterium]
MTKMDAAVCEPFIEAFFECFATFSTLSFAKKKISLCDTIDFPCDKCAAIQVHGSLVICVVVRIPDVIIADVFAFFTGLSESGDEQLLDMLAEISNIVSGSAQRYLVQPNQQISLGLPQTFTQHTEPSFVEAKHVERMMYEIFADDKCDQPIYLELLNAQLA